jgi:hypothetical protein
MPTSFRLFRNPSQPMLALPEFRPPFSLNGRGLSRRSPNRRPVPHPQAPASPMPTAARNLGVGLNSRWLSGGRNVQAHRFVGLAGPPKFGLNQRQPFLVGHHRRIQTGVAFTNEKPKLPTTAGPAPLDTRRHLTHSVSKLDWKFPVGAWPLVIPGALRISGQDLEPVAVDPAATAPPELRLDHVKRPVGLPLAEVVQTDRTRHEVGDLQSR